MSYKLNLTQLKSSSATVTGSEYTIENRETGEIYLTSKVYIDKLFRLMGYKHLGVIMILEEYANKTISDIGDIKDQSIYIDDITDSFIVTSPNSVEWVNRLFEYFNNNGFEILEDQRYNPYYYWDQIVVKSPTGCCYAMYIDLADEYLQVLALDYDSENKKIKGVLDEGSYKFSEGEDSFSSLITLISNPVDISPEFTLDQKLSIYEYVELLRSLGYVKKKRNKYYATEASEEVLDFVGNLDAILEEINTMSWIQQRINETPNRANFKDACDLISLNLDNVNFWSVKDFFINNAKEKSDFFALNY